MDNPPPSVTPAPAAKGGLGTPGAAKPEGKAKDDCGAGGSSMKAQKEGCASGAKARAETG